MCNLFNKLVLLQRNSFDNQLICVQEPVCFLMTSKKLNGIFMASTKFLVNVKDTWRLLNCLLKEKHTEDSYSRSKSSNSKESDFYSIAK